MVAIRKATLEDVESLLDLYEAVAAEGDRIAAELPIDRVDRVRRWRENQLEAENGCILVAELNGVIVGHAGVTDHEGLVDLGMLVSSDHRRRGIGRALIAACVEWARERGAHKITLEVWPNNEPAIRLYESAGFVEEGRLLKHYRRKNGEIWDSIVMGFIVDPSE